MHTIFKSALAVTIALGVTTASAMANLVAGTFYETTAMNASAAAPSTLVGLTPSGTFIAPSTPLSFASGPLYTVGEFLASGSATSIAYLNGAASGDSLNNTLFDFKGNVTVTNGQMFTLGHDDGATLVIGGVTALSAPGPTGFNTSPITYTGPSGTFAFELVYGECCGAPAALDVTLPLITPNIPEPASFAIVGASLIGLAALRTRR